MRYMEVALSIYKIMYLGLWDESHIELFVTKFIFILINALLYLNAINT